MFFQFKIIINLKLVIGIAKLVKASKIETKTLFCGGVAGPVQIAV